MSTNPEVDRRCPKCECRISTLMEPAGNFFGNAIEKRRCNFCSHSFRIAIPKDPKMLNAKAAAYDHDPAVAVTYHSEAVRSECPFCRAVNPPVTRVMPASGGLVVRYHKCRNCDKTFHSEERQGDR